MLTNIIKNRPKNVVKLKLYSLTTAVPGLIKKQTISKCFHNNLTAPKMKMTLLFNSFCLEKAKTNGINIVKAYAATCMAITICGKNRKFQSSVKNQLSTVVFSFASNLSSFSNSLEMPI